MKLSINLSKVQLKKSQNQVTGKMGLSWVVHSMKHFGLENMVTDEFGHNKKSNREIDPFKKIMTGAMNLISGGSRLEDIEVLRKDTGLLESLGWDDIVCSDTVLNFIDHRRNNAKNRRVNNQLIVKGLKSSRLKEFTYDNDATYIDSAKNSAKYSYQKRKQFSGLIGSISELGLINTVEYRKGNISPSSGVFGQLRKAIHQAKGAGKKITKFRSDSAGHQNKIFTYCDMNDVEYYVSLRKNKGIQKVISQLRCRDWKTMYGKAKDQHGTQWAEIKYVVSKGFSVRMLVLRWKNPDPDLFDMSPYCYHAVGTNNWDMDPMEWLEFHNGRMGSIEHCNKELKSGYGCNYTPSHGFEKNRGHFLMGVIAHNMIQIMKLFYFGKSAKCWRIKTTRFWFINVCGKIVKSGRRFMCKVMNITDDTFEIFQNCHRQLKLLI